MDRADIDLREGAADDASETYGDPGMGASGCPRGYAKGPPLDVVPDRTCSLLAAGRRGDVFLLEPELGAGLAAGVVREGELRVADCERRFCCVALLCRRSCSLR